MKLPIRKSLLVISVASLTWLCNGSPAQLVASATAEPIGHPATPVSYAGVARRTTVRHAAAAPVATAAVVAPVATAAVVAPVATAAVVAPVATAAVLTPGLGAPGVGVEAGNRGGPVNRVGVR